MECKKFKMCSTIIKSENNAFISSSKNSYETLIFSGGNDKKNNYMGNWRSREVFSKIILIDNKKRIITILYIEKLNYFCSGRDDKII